MISTPDKITPEQELINIFQKSPGTQWGTERITSWVKRWWYGLDSDEDLIEGHYTNGDLTMKYKEAMTDATSEILNLTIIDSKSGVSADNKIIEKDDLVHRLRVMEQQRARKERERWDEAMT